MNGAARLQQLLDVANLQQLLDAANPPDRWNEDVRAVEHANDTLCGLAPDLAQWAVDVADELARHCGGCTSPDTTGLCDACALLERLDTITGGDPT